MPDLRLEIINNTNHCLKSNIDDLDYKIEYLDANDLLNVFNSIKKLTTKTLEGMTVFYWEKISQKKFSSDLVVKLLLESIEVFSASNMSKTIVLHHHEKPGINRLFLEPLKKINSNNLSDVIFWSYDDSIEDWSNQEISAFPLFIMPKASVKSNF